MKKTVVSIVSIVTALLVSALIAATPCFATPMADISLSMNRIAEYTKPFSNGGGTMRGNYFRATMAGGLTEENLDRVAALGRDSDAIDTPLEIAMLASSVGVINIAPVEAGALGTPKQTDLQLGALLMTEIAVMGFLGNRDAVGIREGVLQHVIIARGNVTRAEIDAYYRGQNGIRALVNEIVDAEFSKQDTTLKTSPAEVYIDWHTKRFVIANNGQAVNGVDLVKETLTRFFLEPDQDNLDRVRGILARIVTSHGLEKFNMIVEGALAETLVALSPELMTHIKDSWGGLQNMRVVARQPDDPAFRIFEIQYDGTQR